MTIVNTKGGGEKTPAGARFKSNPIQFDPFEIALHRSGRLLSEEIGNRFLEVFACLRGVAARMEVDVFGMGEPVFQAAPHDPAGRSGMGLGQLLDVFA